MEPIEILGLVGGISKNSLNKKLFNAAQILAPRNIMLEAFEIAALPFFTQDMENDLPQIVRDFKEKVKMASGILIITPEYNRSFPGVLKNALDWGSRPYGQSVWNKKPAGVMGASVANTGTFGAQNHLRQVLVTLNMPTMAHPEFYINASKSFDENGNLIDIRTKELLLKYWQCFAEWIARF